MTEDDARRAAAEALHQLCQLLISAEQKINSRVLLPDLMLSKLDDYATKIVATPTGQEQPRFVDLVKSDFARAGPKEGHIEFKAFTVEPLNKKVPIKEKEEFGDREFYPFRLFKWPPESQSANWCVVLCMEAQAFSIDYDFTLAKSAYYKVVLNDLQVTLAYLSKDPDNLAGELKKRFWTPPVGMNVTILIPTNLSLPDLGLPEISFSFFGLTLGLDLNFNLNFPPLHLNFLPLHLSLPDWLGWPFGRINIGGIQGCDWSFPDIGIAAINWKAALDWFKWLIGKLGFNFSGGSIKTFYETRKDEFGGKIPEWAAIYFNLSSLTNVLGDFAPKALHFLAGVHKKDQQLRAGFLACTNEIKLLNGQTFMFDTLLEYEFAYESGEIQAHPGFRLEFLGGAGNNGDLKKLAKDAGCSENPSAPSIEFAGLSIAANTVRVHWLKDQNVYACTADGEIAIKNLLKSADGTKPFKISFKNVGFTTGGDFVAETAWTTLTKGQLAKLDGLSGVGIDIRALGFGKEAGKDLWVGFTGGITLPVLDISARVDNLKIWSNGYTELSGVEVDYELKNTFKMSGAVKWNAGLLPPILPPDAASVKGFGGELHLSLMPVRNFECELGFTYARVNLKSSGSFIAWSFHGDASFPAAIPICAGIGLKSAGIMLGQNYLPLPKKKLPADQWLESGFDGDVENILRVVKYWAIDECDFAAGLSVGLCTMADHGYLINAKAILVLIIPGPVVMIAGKAVLLRASAAGSADLLIVYDQSDPGILAQVAFRYNVGYLLTAGGIAEIYFDFVKPERWHFYLGTPDKPVSGNVLGVFQASAYFTLDNYKMAAGAKVYYGKEWSCGPVSAKARLYFTAAIGIGWNPVFTLFKVGVGGDVGARIFGFGLDAGVDALLTVKAPNPWYLEADIALHFSISFFFFSISFTVRVDLSWGSDTGKPDVVLPPVYDKTSYLKPVTSSLDAYASLMPPANTVVYLPMDGVLPLEFHRDILIADPQNLADTGWQKSTSVRHEPSPNAGNYQRFRARLNKFGVQKQAANGAWNAYSKKVYFSWTPYGEEDRAKLRVHDFDSGFTQFRLNDDPNMHVKLCCPDLFEAFPPLVFDLDNPDLTGYSVLNSIAFHCDSPVINIDLSKTKPGPESYHLNYPGFKATLSGPGVIVVKSDLLLLPGQALELDQPSAGIFFVFQPASTPSGTLRIGDYFALLDDDGSDITAQCDNKTLTFPWQKSIGVVLNDFDAQLQMQKAFSYQDPPKFGVKRIVVKKAGTMVRNQDGGSFGRRSATWFLSLYPLAALRHVHQQNVDRLIQRAQLKYDFEQNKDHKGILWETGTYRVAGKLEWDVGTGIIDVHDPKNPKDLDSQFVVIPPFSRQTMKRVRSVNGEATEDVEVEIQPFESYVRRITPSDGARPVYCDQDPVVTFRCNYVNDMLGMGGKRLAMFLVDSANQPVCYTTPAVSHLRLSDDLKGDFTFVLRNAKTAVYTNTVEYQTGVAATAGVSAADLSTAYGHHLDHLLHEHTEDGPADIRVSNIWAGTLIEEAQAFCARRVREGDKAALARAQELEGLISQGMAVTDSAVAVAFGGRIRLFKIRREAHIAEYRYVNDDLALDVSSLKLSDCLNPSDHTLNGYERGYFKPFLPANASFKGLSPSTRYTAQIYCLDKDAVIDDQLPDPAGMLASFSFATSVCSTPDDFAKTFAARRVRTVSGSPELAKQLRTMLSDHSAELRHSEFSYRTSSLPVQLGLDLFRKMNAVTSPPLDTTLREVEEAWQSLLDGKRTELAAERKTEGAVFDEFMETLGIDPDPLPAGRVVATWLTTEETPAQTAALMLDFPEPVDWERTGIRIASFKIVLEDSTIVDLLHQQQGPTSYSIDYHWIRSLDGTRLVLAPKLVAITYRMPIVLEPRARGWAAVQSQTAVAGTGAVPTPSPGSEGKSQASFRPRFAGDYAVSQGILEAGRMYKVLGRKVVRAISSYTVIDLQLEFCYLSDNYEQANPKYRPIPRLQFTHGSPGGAEGKAGILSVGQVALQQVMTQTLKGGD